LKHQTHSDLLDAIGRRRLEMISADKNRQILIEYILFRDINDSEKDALKLVEALHNINCKINLISYNESPSLPFRQSSEATTIKFMDILISAGFLVIERRSRGSDISAACGQLAGDSAGSKS
jgi:23S rRNA (adenine2503-C2)-methyltransferase